MSKRLEALIVKIAQEFTDQNETTISTQLNGETPLFGPAGIVDSVGLVSIIVALEQAIEDEVGVSISLADEDAMSQHTNPYETIGTLARYADQVIQGEV